jgi:hypothetical protein
MAIVYLQAPRHLSTSHLQPFHTAPLTPNTPLPPSFITHLPILTCHLILIIRETAVNDYKTYVEFKTIQLENLSARIVTLDYHTSSLLCSTPQMESLRLTLYIFSTALKTLTLAIPSAPAVLAERFGAASPWCGF